MNLNEAIERVDEIRKRDDLPRLAQPYIRYRVGWDSLCPIEVLLKDAGHDPAWKSYAKVGLHPSTARAIMRLADADNTESMSRRRAKMRAILARA